MKTKKVKWILWGLFYLLLIIGFFIIASINDQYPNNPVVNSLFGIASMTFFISWIVSVFHTFSIRKEYLYHLSQIPEEFVQTSRFDQRTGRHINMIQRNLGKHGKILASIENLRNNIVEELKKAGKQNSMTIELMPIVDRYVSQTEELTEKDAKIEQLLQNSNIKEIDFKIRELRRKIDRTGNAELMQQYMDSISSLEQSKKLFQNFEDQREVIRLKLEGAEMDLKKMKMNLLNMQNLSSQDQNNEYFRDFENKSQELTSYLELLKEYK
jgi:cell fate (sporulation/competence/biofilm development) regulator YlbF (YheA/YmcA/DUF963 family)